MKKSCALLLVTDAVARSCRDIIIEMNSLVSFGSFYFYQFVGRYIWPTPLSQTSYRMNFGIGDVYFYVRLYEVRNVTLYLSQDSKKVGCIMLMHMHEFV